MNHEVDTGPLPRAAILSRLEEQLASSEGSLLFMFKVEGLKSLNHAHGIRFGDAYLARLADRLLGFVGVRERVGVLHGDVFVVIDHLHPQKTTDAAVRRAAQVFSEPLELEGVTLTPRVTIGFATATPGEGTVDQMLAEAGTALRAAQSQREPIMSADKGLRSRAYREGVVARDLAAALDNDDLHLVYQPVVHLDRRQARGAESLIRWDHAEIGAVSPELIIDAVSELGLVDRFTEWTVNTAVRSWAELTARRPELAELVVSVNLNEHQLAHRHSADTIARALQHHGLEPGRLVVEVVESGPTAVGEDAEATLRQLADHGLRIVLDDFGTGHNALEYFLRFPIHGIKFDRALTGSVANDEVSKVIVEGVAAIAQKLSVTTLGEGIETSADVAQCEALGLTFGQGWHIARPMTIDGFEAWVDEMNAHWCDDALAT